MNLIPMIAKELGVEVGEEFRIKDESGIDEDFHRFTDCGLVYYDQAMCEWQESARIIDLIDGRAEVVKKPFEPKDGERYWYVYWNYTLEYPCVTDIAFEDSDMCYHHIYCGNCFRTKTEAEMRKYEIYEKLTGRKWEEKDG
jgi:hypothetical protein